MSPAREADCRYCGKAEGDPCPACGGINAANGAAQKRHARSVAERAGAGSVPPRIVTERTDGGKPGPDGDETHPGAE